MAHSCNYLKASRFFTVALVWVLFSVFAAPGEATTLIAFGDSITAGFDSDVGRETGGYVPILQSLLSRMRSSVTIINAGIGGETTAGGLARLPNLLATTPADIILFMEGTNDISAQVPAAEIRDNMSAMIDAAVEAGVVPILASVIPRVGDPLNRDPGNARAQLLRDLLRDLATQRGVRFVDQYQHFASFPNYSMSLYSDHLHPNSDGYDRLCDGWYSKVKTLIPGGGTADTIPPSITGIDPPPDSESVDPNVSLQFRLSDSFAGVALDNSSVRVNGIKVVPFVTGTASQFHVEVIPASPFTSGELVTVKIHAEDRAEPPNSRDLTYTFTVGLEGPGDGAGDVTGDGRVDGLDLGRLGRSFGSSAGEERYDRSADLDGNGFIDGNDLSIIAANFGKEYL